MNSLKILYVDTDRVWRGGQEQLFSLMLGIRDRQHQVWLAAPSDSPLSGKALQSGIETYPLWTTKRVEPLGFSPALEDLRQARLRHHSPEHPPLPWF